MGYEKNGALERTRVFTVKPPGGEEGFFSWVLFFKSRVVAVAAAENIGEQIHDLILAHHVKQARWHG